MLKRYFLILSITFIIENFLKGNELYYNNKILFYLDNKILDFKIEEDQKTTSLKDINSIFKKENILQVYQWLPMARPTDRNGDIYLNRYYVVEFVDSKNNIDRIIDTFLSLDPIASCEKIPIVRPAFIPNDELWDQLYGLPQVKAHLAYDLWDIESGILPGQMDEGNIVVAVPDIGLMWDHPDLVDNIWQNPGEDADGDGLVLEYIDNEWVFDPDDLNGIDDDQDGFVDNLIGYDVAFGDNDPYPVNSYYQHGTKVAGNIAAVTNNGIGLASVGYSVKVMGVNANGNPDDPSSLTHTSIAVLAAAQMGADIINCSWTSGYSDASNNLFQTLYNEYDCITLGAAGNGENNGGPSDTTDFDPRYPAAFENVISVTAMSPNDSFNCWANAHETVDLSAPGEAIICTMPFDMVNPEQYAIGNGTSYATPLTAGAVALIKSLIPEASKETIISKIIETTDSYSDMTKICNGQSVEGLLGSGQLNIYRAVLATREPELLVSDIDFNTDDGLLHPGDTIAIDFILTNSPSFLVAEDVTVDIITNDTNLTVLSDLISYDNVFSAGDQAEGQFIIAISDNAYFGSIDCDIVINAISNGSEYSNNIPLQLPVYFGQFGYPIPDIHINQSPIITDLNNNSLGEIYFSVDNHMYGTMIAGMDVPGFPFTASGSISTVPAVGDLNGDNDKELVFGTSGGAIYALTDNGAEHLFFEQPDSIRNAPVLADIDSNGELDIIFVAGNANASSLHIISSDGQNLDGFPVSISERIISGPAVSDLDNDSLIEVVLTTTENNIFAIDSYGSFIDGFPFTASASFKLSACVVDLDNDQDLEIVAGNVSGDLYAIHHDGSLMMNYSVEGPILSGISVGDLDNSGQLELLFMASDGNNYDNPKIHAYEPVNQSEISGWPISVVSESYGELIITDIDSDDDLEVVVTTLLGQVHIFHHDGSSYNNFPYSSESNIITTAGIGDLDNDNDFELIVATSNSLEVIDLQYSRGDRYSWNMFRGNLHRTGYYDATLAMVGVDKNTSQSSYSISDNYPNPFNPVTHIYYYLPKKSYVYLSIYDILGRKVITLKDGLDFAGEHTTRWNSINQNGESVSAGMYFYKFESGNFRKTKKMILLK